MATHTKDLSTFSKECWVYKPDGWDAASVDTYPVLVMLHGSGAKAGTIDTLLTVDAPTPTTEINTKINTPDFAHNCVILSPHSTGDWFVGVMRTLMDSIINNKDVLKADISKIVLTGLSLGGIGCSEFIQNPVANGNYRSVNAIFPIAGGSQTGNDVAQDAVDRNIHIIGWQGANDSSSFSNPRMENDRDEMNAIQPGYYDLRTITGGTHSASTWGKVYDRQDANAVPYDIYAYTAALNDITPPTVPDNLAANNVTKHSANITWDSSTDADSGLKEYKVFVDDVETFTVNTNSVDLRNILVPDTSYDIEVLAIDNLNNQSAKSSILSFTTLEDVLELGGKNKSLLI